MMSTEVVDTTDQIHASLQSFDLPSQGAATPDKIGQALAEGGIQPLDEGGVDHASILTGFEQPLDQLVTPAGAGGTRPIDEPARPKRG